jgi:hypothetical protein
VLQLLGRLRRGLGLPLTDRILWADVRVDRFRLHRSWQPRPQSTPTTIFGPTSAAGGAEPTWRPWFRGPLEVVPTPDPHLGDAAIAEASELLLESWRELGERKGALA